MNVQQLTWQNRTLTVALPKSYETDPRRLYPAIFVQDGSYLFAGAVEQARKEVVFIGIEPVNRLDEYTPWEETILDQHSRGYADDYLTLLETGLIPFIASQYRISTAPEHLGIGGASFGGLLSVYALFTKPEVFGNFICISPSLWYPGFIDFLRQQPAVESPKKLFLYVGGEEGKHHRNILNQMVEKNKEAFPILQEKLAHPQSQARFSTNAHGTHLHHFFERAFVQALDFLDEA